MADSKGRRTTGRGKLHERHVTEGRSEEHADTGGNATLELLLQRMNEFHEKLEQLSSGQSKESTTSSREISGESIGTIVGGSTTSLVSEENNAIPSTARNIYVVQPTVNKPIFDGKPMTNPIAFLKRLKKYIKSLNAHDREVDIALECVTGHARKVMELYSKGWATFADFETDFRRHYWTEQIQESVRYRLINAAYSGDSGVTLSEHFAEQAESMQSLTIAFSERDLVNSIMRHYSVDIQQLWFTRADEPTIMNGAEFLRSLEQNVVHKQRTNTIGDVQGNVRRERFVRRPMAATMSAGIWQNRRGQSRGRGYRQGRAGYYSNYNRAAPHNVRESVPNVVRPAIAFVRESETPSTSKSGGEDRQKN